MKTIKEIRRGNARNLRDVTGGNSFFAERIDREATQTSRILGNNPTKNIGEDLARHIERCFDLPEGWLDQDRENTEKHNSFEPVHKSNDFRSVPVIPWEKVSEWNEKGLTQMDTDKLQKLPCPISCGPLTYVLRVVSESMSDDYKPGELIFVDPSVSPTSGNDVVALLTDTGETTFKRLIEEGNKKYLKALNVNWPEKYIPVEDNCKIMGTVIFSGKPRL
ncbi:LexA family transcriptional repressor [Rosenbergiella collisarenosi]|uniref:S24 family peptidase n=1 Tax=Rosenbergiella collisarenosi TaxID=1544695 RepID=UPI001BDAA382|nr:S24 family peptidase [Rosenbergiella collisarenosi]MBT0721095.1 LexA family transcriptional repressor [Rosenbergiella collisarenosi]